MTEECVTKEDCRRIHEDVTYQLNDIKDQIDGVDKKLGTHDKQAQDICSNMKIVSKDVDRMEKTIRDISNIVMQTALIQKQAEEERRNFQSRMMTDKEFYQKLIWRAFLVGSIIILAYFGIVAGEKVGILPGI